MASRETRLYGLFQKNSDGWHRILPEQAYKKSIAVRMWQELILQGAIGAAPPREIRVLPQPKQPVSPARQQRRRKT